MRRYSAYGSMPQTYVSRVRAHNEDLLGMDMRQRSPWIDNFYSADQVPEQDHVLISF